MTYSRGAKLRAKRAMPALAKVPSKKKRGRARMEEISEDTQMNVLTARARQMGLPKSKALDMRDVMLSEEAGKALSLLCPPDAAKRLWGHYIALTASEARNHRSMGISIHPKTAKLEMMNERFETRDDDQIDLRTEQERDEDAQRSWRRWSRILSCLLAHERRAILGANKSNVVMVASGKPLPAAGRFVTAMIRLDSML